MQEEQQPTAAAAGAKDSKSKSAESGKTASLVKTPAASSVAAAATSGVGGGAGGGTGAIEGRVQTGRKLTQRLGKASAESRFNKEEVLEVLRRVSTVGEGGGVHEGLRETLVVIWGDFFFTGLVGS